MTKPFFPRKISRREELTIAVAIASFWGHVNHGAPWQHVLGDLIATPFLFYFVIWHAWAYALKRVHLSRTIVEVRTDLPADVDSFTTVE